MLCYQNKIIPYLDFLSSIILLRFIFNRWCDFISFFTMQCQSFISVRKETKPFWCWRYTWSKQQIEKKNIDEDSEFFKFWQEWARITNIKQYQNRWHWLYSNMELSSIKDFKINERTTPKVIFSIKVSSSKCDQIRRKLRIWSHLLKKSLRSDSHNPPKISVICFIESPIKMIKNAFCFILKALFVLKILKFLSWLLIM